MKIILLVACIFLTCFGVRAQSYPYPADIFGGNTNYPCTWPDVHNAPTVQNNGVGLAITNIILSSGTVTVTVGTTSGLVSNQSVYITGVTDSFYNTNTATSGQVVTVASGTTLTYAGSGSHAASSGGFVAANWYTQLVGRKIYQCTPLGNRIFINSLTSLFIPTSGTLFTGKYSSSQSVAADAEFNQFMGWGFNEIGNFVFPLAIAPLNGSCGGACFPLPQDAGCYCDAYSSVNLNSLAVQATPTFLTAHTANFPVSGGDIGSERMHDAFSPYFSQHLNAFMLTQTGTTTPWLTAYTIGQPIEAGPDFDTLYPARRNGFVTGLLLFDSAPLITGTNSSVYLSHVVSFPDPLNYSKTPMASPPATCGFTHTNECSEFTLFSKEYGTIGAANTAWGTGGFYTTFGSSADQYGYSYTWAHGSSNSAISVGTGDGVTLSFIASGMPTNVDPQSVQILLAGTDIGFDCPVVSTAPVNTCSGSAGTGQILGTNLSGGSINYATGVMTVVFTVAPTNGQAITANLQANGWGQGGTGMLDEDGRNTTWMGQNSVCIKTVHLPASEGTDSFACRTGNPGGYINPASQSKQMNQTLASDIYTLTGNWYAQYFDVLRQAMKGAFNNIQVFSPIDTGTQFAPSMSVIYDAANNFFDALWVITQPTSSADATAQFSYMTAHYTGPYINETYNTACADSAAASHGGCVITPTNSTTQVQRGANFYLLMQQILQVPGADGAFHFIGTEWWGAQDCTTDSGTSNWGLKSCGGASSINAAVAENAYDGSEAAAGAVSCSAPNAGLPCGGEPAPGGSAVRPFGNGITDIGGIRDANALWYANPLPGIPFAPPPPGVLLQ